MSRLDKPRQGYDVGDIVSFVGKNWQDLAKAGTAALSTYASYKDQKKKNEMQKAAYEDYMKQVEAAGKEARAAIDINYTPMTVSNRPTTKADVTDFTAVAAQGGLMSIPNKQRKRYARGPEEWEVETMDEEVLTPYDLQMEEGVNIGEQVRAPGSASLREGAWNVWNSGAINQEIYEFDFEIFFDSGDWKDMLKGDVPMQGLQGNTMMASADPVLQDEYDKYVFDIQEQGGTPMSIEQFRDQAVAGQANGGIIGLRHGGRIGYAGGGDMAHRLSELIKKSNAGTITSEEENEMEQLEIMLDYGPGEKDGGRIGYRFGTPDTDVEIMDEEFVGDNELKMEEGVQIGPMAGGGDRGWRAQMLAEDLAQEQYGKEFYDLSHDKQMEIYTIALDMIDSGGMAKGGRIRKAPGGIMNLGGLEKDYRTTGGFVPIGGRERADDVPARLSKNEFVMTADAVRAAGGGSINKGAQLMYDTMKNLEARPQAQRMTA